MKVPAVMPFERNWTKLNRTAPDWFRDAKFGLFFHWGPYTVPACENEWYSRNMYGKGLSQNGYHVKKYGKLSEFGYKDFLPEFKGEKFDADAWADLAIRSGARYAGPVAEHADHFSMWNSQVNPINSVNYGPKRDVVGELERAIRNRGLKFITTFHHQWLWGWFMSTDPNADVYFPENEKFYGRALPLETNRYIPWRLPDDAFNEEWMRKVLEVADAYAPDLIYFDSRANIIGERFRYQLVDYYYNDCSGSCQDGGRSTDRIICYKQDDFPTGIGIRDVECGRFSDMMDFPWQTDDHLEAERTWCHVENVHYRSASGVIHQLCDTVSKNGNLLLNVGPKEDGSFAGEAISVLEEVGDWLAVNGEAIYGTRPFQIHGEGSMQGKDTDFDVSHIERQTRKGVLEETGEEKFSASDIRFTTHGNVLYAIIMGRPDTETIRIRSLAEGVRPGLPDIERMDMMGGADNLCWKRDASALTVRIKGEFPSPYANVVRIVLRNQKG